MGAAIARVCVSLMYRSGAGRAPVAARRVRAAREDERGALVALRDAQPVGDVRRVEVAPRLVAEQAERHGVRHAHAADDGVREVEPEEREAERGLSSIPEATARARARAARDTNVKSMRAGPPSRSRSAARALSRKKLFARPAPK